MLQLGILSSILLLSIVLLAFAAQRANELFVVSVDAERIEHRRGRIPGRLLEEIRDLLRRDRSHGVIKVISREGRPYLSVRGSFSNDVVQQLRNVVGLYPLAKIRAGKKPR
jgi:hypothetical protein